MRIHGQMYLGVESPICPPFQPKKGSRGLFIIYNILMLLTKSVKQFSVIKSIYYVLNDDTVQAVATRWHPR